MIENSFEALSSEEKQWVESYMDGSISSEEFDLLQDRMLERPPLRAIMRRVNSINHELSILTTTSTSLDEVAIWEESTENTHSHGDLEKTDSLKSFLQSPVLAIAACMAFMILVTGMLHLFGPKTQSIGSIVDLDGPMEWIGNSGEVVTLIKPGSLIQGGQMELLSPESWITIQFHDGSTVTFTEMAKATITDKKGKKIHLNKGSISADINPQPGNFPMRVYTSTAEMTVVGTQFNVETESSSTRLSVNEGEVLFKRMTDGEEIGVTENHLALTHLLDTQALIKAPKPSHVYEWKAQLEQDTLYGKWLPKLWRLSQDLEQAIKNQSITKEEAWIQIKKAAQSTSSSGTTWAIPSKFGSLIMLRANTQQSAPVKINSSSHILIKGISHNTSDIEVGFTVNAVKGGYKGKYSHTISGNEFTESGTEFEIEIPINKFKPIDEKFLSAPQEMELSTFWCLAKEKHPKFGITALELVNNQ